MRHDRVYWQLARTGYVLDVVRVKGDLFVVLELTPVEARKRPSAKVFNEEEINQIYLSCFSRFLLGMFSDR